jgi:hypothetical protein
MSKFDKYWRKIPNRYGVLLAAALIGYFLLMRALGLGHVYWLRALNAFILFFTVRGAILKYRNESSDTMYDEFFNFFKIGMRTAFVGITAFAVFVAIYMDVLDPTFLEEVRQVEKLSPYLTPVTAAGIVFIEGFGSAFVCTYLVIQISKRKTVDNLN